MSYNPPSAPPPSPVTPPLLTSSHDMLDGIMAKYFEYPAANGEPTNLVEAVLLISERFRENTEAIRELTEKLNDIKRK